MEGNVESPSTKLSLEISKEAKISQNQHGLRTNNFNRYREYTTRRAKRIRKALKFTHQKKPKESFQKKTIDPSIVTDERFLLLVLVKSESSWAYAMELKGESDNSRTKIHMHKKMSRAVKYSSLLVDLCKAKADERTTLEAQAYASWMAGHFMQQREDWKGSLSQFQTSKMIYEQLSKVVDNETSAICKEKVEEITTSIEISEYRLKGAGFTPTNDSNSEEIQSKLSIVADAMKKQTDNSKGVTWKGKLIPIKNEKILSALLTAQETSFELDKALDLDAKIPLYDKLFDSYNAIQDVIRDQSKKSNNNNEDSTKGRKKYSKSDSLDLPVELKSYIQYVRLERTIQRNLLLAENLEKQISEETNTGRKRTKPEDLIRIFETLIQNYTELNELSTEEEETKKNVVNVLSFKAFRCYYLALSYSTIGEWAKARVLLERSLEQVKQAVAHLQACKQPDASKQQKLDKYEQQIKARKAEGHARHYLTQLSSLSDQTPKQTTSSDKTLQESMNTFDYSMGQSKKIVSFPPDLEAIACKPTLFDLAGLSIEIPIADITKRSTTQSKSWFGFFSK
eukprot:TRINITY_DN12623_c0_g1_i1.p1 TRINITY_DN12623_c0_g1~~TRINITY_DN12623_c0_g1_i1.p1  ORF type:complete len:567 (-),score=200.59 TRINITY_DN12623_c0_g1_i1:80-1780(-)